MSEELISSVIAARHAAEAEHSNPDGSPRTEAQAAAILLAQVHTILDARPAPPAPPSLTAADVKAIFEDLMGKYTSTPTHEDAAAITAADPPSAPAAPAEPVQSEHTPEGL